MLRKTTPIFLVLALICPAIASADGVELNLALAGAVGGDFVGLRGAPNSKLDSDLGYGLALDVPMHGPWQIELSWLHFEPDLKIDSPGGGRLAEVDLDYYHLGGIRFWEYDTLEPFVVISGGLTEINPGGGLATESRVSFGIGGGTRVYFARRNVPARAPHFRRRHRVGLRFSGRVLGTYASDDAEFFCGAFGCLGEVDDSFLLQAVGDIGVSIRFN